MLLDYGDIQVPKDWHVLQSSAPNFCRVYFIDSGEVIYTDKYNEICFKKGYIYIMPSSIPYEIVHNPENSLKCMYLHIDFFPIVIKNIIEIDCSENIFIKSFFDLLRIAMKSVDIKIISSMCDTFEMFLKENNLISQLPNNIKDIILYIDKNISEKITVKELSKISNYNPQYLIRLFKANIGMSPHQYIISYRLKEATKLFKFDMSITEISEKTGYTDVKSFSRGFKSRYGVSPLEFKRTYLSIP